MKVIINEKLVTRQAAIGKWASLIGMGALLAGLVVSYRWPNLTTASFGCLIIGFLLASVGTYNMNRWVKEPRADQVLTKALKGFDNKHFLYHYTLPATHVLLAPSGIFVFTVKDHHGEIRCEGEKWHHKFNWGRLLLLFGQESLGNPTGEVRREIGKLRRFLDERLPEADVPIEGLIVFTNPGARLELIDPAVPVVSSNKLKAFLRKLKRKKRISAEQRKELAEIFEGA
ncbi:MAG TPA: NERD domain-containing protein [Anaerolineae bacterium]|nr:NERD domain-containing protein [Anaerolineae bacterium]